MPRQRSARSACSFGTRADSASRSISSDVDRHRRAGRSRALGQRGIELPDHADTLHRRPAPPRCGRRPDTRMIGRLRSRAATPMTRAELLGDTLDVEEVDLALGRRSSAPAWRAPVHATAAPRVSPAAKSACRFRRGARRACRGGGCGSRRRPVRAAGSDAASVNFSDSGLASATGA